MTEHGFYDKLESEIKNAFERMEIDVGEIKQTNFRIDQVTADAFRKFCEENGMNQAQGFDHVMQVVEMDKAKAAVPGSAKDIEEFELYVKKIMGAYMKSIEDYNNAKETVREQFASALESKDKMIQELQKKVEALAGKKKMAEDDSLEASKKAAQAVKEAESVKTQAETLGKLVEEKDKTISTLAGKLSLAEEKVQAYDRITEEKEKALMEIKELKTEMEQKLLNAQRVMESAIAEKNKELSDAKKDADLALEKAVMEKEREMMEQIRATECENARLVTKLELFTAQNTEK